MSTVFLCRLRGNRKAVHEVLYGDQFQFSKKTACLSKFLPNLIRSKGISSGLSREGTVPKVFPHFPYLNSYQFYHRFPIFSTKYE